jgi:Tol biopolymer transport system component
MVSGATSALSNGQSPWTNAVASHIARQNAESAGMPYNVVDCRVHVLMQESPARVGGWPGAALDDSKNNTSGPSIRVPQEERLDSWKKIASYLKRDVRTVQRWERGEAMPVHRHLHDKLGSVFAFRSELDVWWESRRTQLAQEGADKRELPAQASQTMGDVSVDKAPPAPRGRLVRLGVALAVVLAALALAWFADESGYFWRSPLANAKFTRLLDFTGVEQAAAISRNGKFVAFLADQDGQIDAWVSEVGSGTFRNLTHGALGELVVANPTLRVLGFSPDASLISIWSRRADGSQTGDVNILAVPTAGGPLRQYLKEAGEFDWSHDGTRLVYHTTAPGDPLFVREPGEPDARRIYVASTGVHCHFPLWSADDAFIYFVRGVPPDDWDIWRIRPSGAGLERITTHNARVTYPVMLDRRTLVYLATDADGSGPWMYAVDVERRSPRRISSGLEGYSSLAGSADGSRLITTIANPRTSVWRTSFTEDRPASTPIRNPSLVLPNGVAPRVGADFLLYVSWRGDRQGIWSLTHGTHREIWGSSRSRIVGEPALARDGRRITFSVEDSGKTLLYVMNFDGSQVRILADSSALRGNPAWDPDGKSVVTAVIRDGEPRLTRFFLNGDAPLPLVSEYSVDPVWSPDGRFVVYSGADVGTTFPLRAAAADGRPYPLPSVMLTRGARRVVFFRDSQTLVILGGEIVHKNFSLLDLRTGTQHIVAELPADFVIRDFDVSADSSEVVFDRVQVNSDLALIERTP